MWVNDAIDVKGVWDNNERRNRHKIYDTRLQKYLIDLRRGSFVYEGLIPPFLGSSSLGDFPHIARYIRHTQRLIAHVAISCFLSR